MDCTRTFVVRYDIELDGAVLEAHSHLLRITGHTWDTITATLDGHPVSPDEARRVTTLALNLGTFQKVTGAA